jgi:hypothetical protein
MRWFRSKLRLGSGLALLAMGVQLVVTFGHIHLDDLIPSSANLSAAATAGPSGSALPDGSGPSQKPDGDHDDDICAICALIQLAAISVPSVAPVLPSPLPVRWAMLEAPVEMPVPGEIHASFRARAPPLA